MELAPTYVGLERVTFFTKDIIKDTIWKVICYIIKYIVKDNPQKIFANISNSVLLISL